METRADIQHKLTLINDSFRSIVSLMENLFDQIYELQRLPAGSWKESEDKRLGRSCTIPEQNYSMEEVIVGDTVVVREKLPAPKKERKKKMVVIASPTGPEILHV